MLWKIFGLQKLLDELFDDTWCSPCVPTRESPSREKFTTPTRD